MKLKEPLESDIEKMVLRFLHFKRVFCWKNHSQGTFDPTTMRRRKLKNRLNGVSDILGILPDGKLLAIEMKRNEKAKRSDDQKKFIKKVNELGGVGFFAWSIETVQYGLKDYL